MPLQSRKPSDTIMFLDKAHSVRKPNKRLRKTFRVIYFVVSLAKKVIANGKNTQFLPRFSPGPSYVAMDIQAIDDVDDNHDHACLFHIDQKALSQMVREKNFNSLCQYGGVKEVAAILETDMNVGITAKESDIKHRIDVFGSNTYEKPPAKSFLSFVFEAFKDTTIIIHLVCAVFSLGFNIFVLCQVFNVFNARKMEEKNIFKGIVKNKLFLGIIGMTVVLQVVMVEFLKKFADTVAELGAMGRVHCDCCNVLANRLACQVHSSFK